MSSLYPKRSASRNVVHCYLYGKERRYHHHHHAPCWTVKQDGAKTHWRSAPNVTTLGLVLSDSNGRAGGCVSPQLKPVHGICGSKWGTECGTVVVLYEYCRGARRPCIGRGCHKNACRTPRRSPFTSSSELHRRTKDYCNSRQDAVSRLSVYTCILV